MLEKHESVYRDSKTVLSNYDMIAYIPILREERKWLKDVSAKSLQVICNDLAYAFAEFRKHNNNIPKKKNKKSPLVFPVCSDSAGFYFLDDTVQIPKVGKVKYKSDFCFPRGRKNKQFKAYNPRVRYCNGKWILSFALKQDLQLDSPKGKNVGIDLGSRKLAVVAYGDDVIEVFPNINKSKEMEALEDRISFYQRKLSFKNEAYRKRTGTYGKTNNIVRLEHKLRKLYARRSNIRNNYIHQITHKIIMSSPKRVTMESIEVKRLMENKFTRKEFSEVCWHEFIRQMKYKCQWNGIEFVQADRFYPSSKICSYCGYINHELGSEETYICPKCGLVLDRDINAALNLMRYSEDDNNTLVE